MALGCGFEKRFSPCFFGGIMSGRKIFPPKSRPNPAFRFFAFLAGFGLQGGIRNYVFVIPNRTGVRKAFFAFPKIYQFWGQFFSLWKIHKLDFWILNKRSKTGFLNFVFVFRSSSSPSPSSSGLRLRLPVFVSRSSPSPKTASDTSFQKNEKNENFYFLFFRACKLTFGAVVKNANLVKPPGFVSWLSI